VDYTKDEGTFHVLDVYVGEAMKDVPRGTVKTLRVVGLDFRAAGIRKNGNSGPGGSAMVCTPAAIGNGSWDVKVPLGDAKVHEDGSVFFRAPARRPFYFMLLDEKGRMVQTMRSWTVLQPGENGSCVGCHEPKNSAPPALTRSPKALIAGAQKLTPFWGNVVRKDNAPDTQPGPRHFAVADATLSARGLSFPRDIQPVLDTHCVRCHNGNGSNPNDPKNSKDLKVSKDPNAPKPAATTATKPSPQPNLSSELVLDKRAGRAWSRSYLSLTHSRSGDRYNDWTGLDTHPVLNWISAASVPTLLKPYPAGSNTSKLFKLLDAGHGKTKISPAEIALLAAWVDLSVPYSGDYVEGNIWNETEQAKHDHYQQKRDALTAADIAVLNALKEK
jgi:mono/diheme cytochrome c family protein